MKKSMKTEEIMQHIDELLANHSNEECVVILREVIDECEARIENYEEGVYSNL